MSNAKARDEVRRRFLANWKALTGQHCTVPFIIMSKGDRAMMVPPERFERYRADGWEGELPEVN